jgi:hypothetical protein
VAEERPTDDKLQVGMIDGHRRQHSNNTEASRARASQGDLPWAFLC